MNFYSSKALVISIIALALGLIIFGILFTSDSFKWKNEDEKPAEAAAVPNEFRYSFSVPGRLSESASMDESTSPYWWLDSGGYMEIASGTGRTIHGSLPDNDRWRIMYARNNGSDTADGLQPQNLFRLISRNVWTDFSQEAYFRIDAINESPSPNKNESNGLLLFGRYKDGDNLYYAGIRVDGNAIIKKKMNGTYYTLASRKIFDGSYDPVDSPNVLPLNTWMGIRMETRTASSTESLAIFLLTDLDADGQWEPVLQAIDDGKSYGGEVISGPAYVGIRTDFMDVSFRDYYIRKIE